MRKLASIQIIKDITPIPGADRIVCASILGWKVVVKKDQFQIGDKCVYFEVDSFLPIEDRYEFLRNSSYKCHPLLGEGFRIKTQKMKGVISQGLLFTLSGCGLNEDLPVGSDVTDKLHVRKWEGVEVNSNLGTMITGLPYSISPTNETRIQSIPEIINEFKDLEYYITTKIDGTSVTMCMKDGVFKVCSHVNEIKNDGKSYIWDFAKKIKLEEKMKKLGFDNLAIQGEFAGPKIQGNKLQLKEAQWFVFTMIDLKNLSRLDYYKTKDICHQLGLTMVPVEEIDDNLMSHYPSPETLLQRAKGNYPCGRKKEGIVIRPTYPRYSYLIGGDLSFKVLNNDFLLKEK